MVYGTRVCPGWYQGAPRPARGRRERDVVFGMLMVDTEHPTSNYQHPTSNIQHRMAGSKGKRARVMWHTGFPVESWVVRGSAVG